MIGPHADDVRSLWPAPDGVAELNPATLVAEVIEMLRQRGMAVSTTINSTAIIASADLLRSLGVRPASAPRSS